MLDLVPQGIYKKIEKIDLNKTLKFKDNMYDVLMCVGTFTYGHVKPKALDELIRIIKNGGLICFTINEGIYEEYGFDKKIKELSDSKSWNIQEFFKSKAEEDEPRLMQGLGNRSREFIDKYLRESILVSIHTRNIGGM